MLLLAHGGHPWGPQGDRPLAPLDDREVDRRDRRGRRKGQLVVGDPRLRAWIFSREGAPCSEIAAPCEQERTCSGRRRAAHRKPTNNLVGLPIPAIKRSIVLPTISARIVVPTGGMVV